MDSWQTTLVVVVALLVGAAIPVLVQLSLTLRAARVTLEKTAGRLDVALDAVSQVAQRLDRITAGIDEARVRSLLEAADSLALTLRRVQDSVRVATAVGAAVGPAVGAAVRAWRAGPPGDGAGEGPHPGPDAEEKEEAR